MSVPQFTCFTEGYTIWLLGWEFMRNGVKELQSISCSLILPYFCKMIVCNTGCYLLGNRSWSPEKTLFVTFCIYFFKKILLCYKRDFKYSGS